MCVSSYSSDYAVLLTEVYEILKNDFGEVTLSTTQAFDSFFMSVIS
jgi:hypothetical protein